MSVSNKIAPYTKVILALSKSERACGQLLPPLLLLLRDAGAARLRAPREHMHAVNNACMGQLSQLSQLSQLNSSWAS